MTEDKDSDLSPITPSQQPVFHMFWLTWLIADLCGRASTRALRPKICQPPNTASPRKTSEAAKSKSMRWCYTLLWQVVHRCGMDVMRSKTVN